MASATGFATVSSGSNASVSPTLPAFFILSLPLLLLELPLLLLPRMSKQGPPALLLEEMGIDLGKVTVRLGKHLVMNLEALSFHLHADLLPLPLRMMLIGVGQMPLLFFLLPSLSMPPYLLLFIGQLVLVLHSLGSDALAFASDDG